MSGTNVSPQETIERWLNGEALADTPAYAQALDTVYGAGPDRTSWEKARRRLAEGLAAHSPRAYYDRLASELVGPLWVAVTDHGLAAVSFGGSESEFASWIERHLHAGGVRSAERTAVVRRELAEYLGGRRTAFSVPVDLRHVTPFQRQVLEAARRVPRGSVATYGELGRRIGRPRAARAVGQALGSNPVPIVVPCHRVLASDGSLGGYSGRGGLRTKRRLLALEGALLV
jgi:methylated-DNA-[protein]-cysteine S-methyltransferase